jgi:hypothetical protein
MSPSQSHDTLLYMTFPTREADIMSRIYRRLQEGRLAGYDR